MPAQCSQILIKHTVFEPEISKDVSRFQLSHVRYTANFYPIKTTGTVNCGVPAGKTCTIYGVKICIVGTDSKTMNPEFSPILKQSTCF